ncbi:hypothetical protein PFMG_02660, partial [Plasmodium falciparum IGH-CR14]
EYIYNSIELIKYNKDVLKEKENDSYIYTKNNINVNKYVGKIINHLKVNKGNSGLIYFLPTVVDIYFFNYFQLNYKYKLLFVYNILNINNVKCFVSTHQSIEKKKTHFLNNFCKILLYNDIYSYINQVHIIYIKKKKEQEQKEKGKGKGNKRELQKEKDKSYNLLYQNEAKNRDCQNNNIIPFYKKNILDHLLSHVQNAKDLCIFLFIVRNINAIHSFLLRKIIRQVDIVPVQCIISYLQNFKKVETQNYFNTFYQMLCIKFLLKRGKTKKRKKKKHDDYNDHNDQNIKYLFNYTNGFYHPLNINYFIFYKYIINKLINHSFNLYVSKVEKKNKCLKESIHYLFVKYQDNYIYEFTKSKYFYYIYLKEVIKRKKKKKKKMDSKRKYVKMLIC